MDAIRRFLDGDVFFSFKRSPLVIAAFVVSVGCIVAAAGAGFLAPHNPFDLATLNLLDAFTPPAWTERGNPAYLLGTDDQGRDVLSAIMYGSRALLIAGYLLMPRTPLTYYLFAAGLGFTWLATVPPTAALVGKLFGVRYLATLFGMTLLSHQIGGFFGAYLGGWAITRFGDYGWMWYADMTLAALAAVVNLPIREAPVAKPAVA